MGIGTYVCMYVHMHIQLCLLTHHGFWLTDGTTSTQGCDEGQEPEPFQTFSFRNSQTLLSEGRVLGPVFFQKWKTQPTPIRVSFFFHTQKIIFHYSFPRGGSPSRQREVHRGNSLAEIKQISLAVCPSAHPSVNNL